MRMEMEMEMEMKMKTALVRKCRAVACGPSTRI